MSMGITAAFADPSAYIITIDNAVYGETYTAYKIFDVTYANANSEYTAPTAATDIPGAADNTHQYTAYAYTISQTSDWWSVVTTEGTTSKVPATVELGTTFTANGLKYTKTATANEWSVEATDSFDAAAFAVLLNNNKTGKTSAASGTGDAKTNKFPTDAATDDDVAYWTGALALDAGSAGYFFVDTTTGSLCSLDTTEPTAIIREKNSIPTQDKSVSDSATGTYGDSTTANIGDTVYFKIDVTDGTGTDTTLTVHDTMCNGLTLNADSFTIQANTGAESALETVAAANYTITTTGLADGCTFEIEFKADYVKSLDTGKVITIKYTAKVNENAEIAETGNPNTSKVKYSNQWTPEDTAKVYTYAGAIYKVDGTKTSGTAPELAGAKFAVTIETPAAGETPASSTPVKFTRVQAGSDTTPAIYKYNPSATGTDANIIETPASGAVVFIGFKNATVLTLTETVAPTGFNKLSAAQTVTINAQSAATADKSATTTGGATATFVATTFNTETGAVAVSGDDGEYQINANSIVIIENKTGAELPSTGGIGTTIFYVVGSILVVAAGVLLITKKRMSREG